MCDNRRVGLPSPYDWSKESAEYTLFERTTSLYARLAHVAVSLGVMTDHYRQFQSI